MKHKNSISVIIPVYNGSRYIAEALESVIKQSFQAFEIIVIDDGSSDSLDKALKPYSSRIRLFRQENKGQANARNRGIRTAKCELLGFLDADDYWKDSHLEVLYTHLNDNEHLDYVIGRVKNFMNDFSGDQSPLEHYNDRDGLAGFVPGAGLFRKKCFERVGLFDESYRLAEVIDWSSRAFDYRLKFDILDQVTLMRRIHGKNNGLSRISDQHEYLRALRASLKRRAEMKQGIK